ncbi:hypothetical protein [Cellulomonas sp. S1-8]|nr:hypothetical protein [Cellulomonas sp. S1-8]UZN04204.1 hypothetical protein OKX07_04505 [Cellulomonas sp. S1-8]
MPAAGRTARARGDWLAGHDALSQARETDGLGAADPKLGSVG